MRSLKAMQILAILAAVMGLASTAFAGQAAEKAAARLLRERMKTQNPGDLAILEAVSGKEIVVVKGSMDHIEDVLRAAGIRHTVIGPGQVAKADIMADQIVMVNCPGNIPMAGVRRIAKFVRAGGSLYTTDWSLKNLIEKAFPGTIKHNGRSTGDHVTAVQVHRHHDNMMTNVLLKDDSKPQWWLEGGSYPIKIINDNKVEILASSKSMGRQYGASPVVVRFKWDDGQVIHVVSHFYRQVATRGPQVASKNSINEVKGLTKAQKKSFADSKDGEVSMSELESSYAFQQMTTNLVTGKIKSNKDLDKRYQMKNRAVMTLEGRALAVGTRLKVIGRKQGKLRVRDDRGNEGWVIQDSVEVR